MSPLSTDSVIGAAFCVITLAWFWSVVFRSWNRQDSPPDDGPGGHKHTVEDDEWEEEAA